MMLAQSTDLPAVPAETLKWVLIILTSLLFIAVGIVGLILQFRKQAPVKLADDPAIEVRKASKRYNHEAVDQRFVQIETRLTGHDEELDSAWKEMKEIRSDAAEKYTDIAVSLAEIKVHLGIKNASSK